MRKLFLLLMTLIACNLSLMAQTRTYKGTVVDAATDEPLIGATVLPVGGGQGAATDADGKFSISVPSNVKTVKVSYVGYTTDQVPLTDNMVVRLKSSAETLDDVMVVAFGTTTKEAFTGSAAVVNTDEIAQHTTSNVSDALVGSVPGLQLRKTSGAPGTQGTFNIRGIASLYADADPLVIVDGAPFPDGLASINQNDIASISVLKDAASAALYGARGAAGVIIITTKRGQNREAQIRFDAKWGANTRAIQDYDVIKDPGQFYEAYYSQLYNYNYYGKGMSAAAATAASNNMLLNQLVYNVYTLPEGENLIGANGKLNPNATLGRYYEYNGERRYLTPDNWLDEAYRTGFRQEYNLSVNGGTDRTSYYTSVSYLGDEGILIPSSYDRVTARFKGDYQAKKWLKIGANLTYTHSKREGNPDMDASLGAGNILYTTSMIAPIYPLFVRSYDDQNNPYIMQTENGMPMYDFGVRTYTNASRPFAAPGNPVGGQRYDQSSTTLNSFNGTFNATVDFTDYLRFEAVSNVNWVGTMQHYFGNPLNPLHEAVNGQLTKHNYNYFRTNNTQTLTFYKHFGEHYVNVLAGHEYYRMQTNYLAGQAEGAFSPAIKELAAFANRQLNTTSSKSRYNVEGWFGSAQYNFREKYYASASYRRDASSRFAKGNRWGDFWSFGAAWMISKEDFMEKTRSWLDYLKLKVSIGQQGNDQLPSSYYWIDQYSLQITSKTQMSPSFYVLGNPDITWETTTNFNLGLEFGFFNNRLTGTLDFYNKDTRNLLFWLSVPESTGSRGYYGNVGDIRNTGVELSLTGTPIRTKDYEWSISANISTNKTKIVKLPESKTTVGESSYYGYKGFYESSRWYEVGEPMYNYMTLAYAGVNEQGQALYYYDPNLIQDSGSMLQSVPGKIKSKEYTTTVAENGSRYACGSTLPKAYGGFSTTARIKWFDITATFDYQIGGKVFDAHYQALMTPQTNLAGGTITNFHKDYAKAWSPNNPNSNIPRWQAGDSYAAYTSDRFLTNAGYLNFQSFTVGFTLPKLFKEIEKIRVYCAGENLCFWSARKGFDPRYSFSENESVGAYSPMRTVSGGVEVIF